jgi:peptidoglycan/LPS O-acetylase OafA/YrhL
MMDVIGIPAISSSRHDAKVRGGRNGEIEALRAIAVLMVLVQHVPDNLIFWHTREYDFFTNTGFWTGVDLFFAISGFVIARSLLPQLHDVQDITAFVRVTVTFWLRRAWRILPSAWFWLAAPLPLCVLFNRSGAYGSLQANWEQFVAGILDLANFRFDEVFFRFPAGTAFVQWSLSLEEQFYLLLPVAAFLLRRYLPAALLLLAASGFLLPDTVLWHMLRGGAVAFGVLLAIWSWHPTYKLCAPAGMAQSRTARVSALVIGIACLISLGSPPLHIVWFPIGPISLVAAFLVWLASYDGGYLWRPSPARRLMELVGARSYSLYLAHVPVYFAVHELWFRQFGARIPRRGEALAYIMVAAAALAITAELNHRLLEEPLRRRGKRIAARFATQFREDPA